MIRWGGGAVAAGRLLAGRMRGRAWDGQLTALCWRLQASTESTRLAAVTLVASTTTGSCSINSECSAGLARGGGAADGWEVGGF
eukprot:COSAG01_NODE_558_length_15478_cov_217.596788_12_plen_84_part_00